MCWLIRFLGCLVRILLSGDFCVPATFKPHRILWTACFYSCSPHSSSTRPPPPSPFVLPPFLPSVLSFRALTHYHSVRSVRTPQWHLRNIFLPRSLSRPTSLTCRPQILGLNNLKLSSFFLDRDRACRKSAPPLGFVIVQHIAGMSAAAVGARALACGVTSA